MTWTDDHDWNALYESIESRIARIAQVLLKHELHTFNLSHQSLSPCLSPVQSVPESPNINLDLDDEQDFLPSASPISASPPPSSLEPGQEPQPTESLALSQPADSTTSSPQLTPSNHRSERKQRSSTFGNAVPIVSSFFDELPQNFSFRKRLI